MAGRLGIISAPVMGGKKKSLPVYDRYVNTVTGSDGNDGLSMATAWKTPDYASAMMSAAQTLGIVAPATSPIRNGFAPATAGLICGGLTSARRAYIAGTVDVSQGKACENLIFNGNCEGWLSASSMWGANLSAGNPIARSEEKHSGKYSIDATRTSSTMYIEFYVYLPANTEVTLTYWHKDATVNARWRYLVREVLATSNYLQSDGSWATGSYTHQPNDYSDEWHSFSVDFTTNGSSRYLICLIQPHTGTIYLDDISLVYKAGNYAWQAVDGESYKVLNVAFPRQPYLLGKCTASAWSTSGMEALAVVSKAADLETLGTTPNAWFYDSDTKLVYYHPAEGEDLEDIHLELSQNRTSPTTASEQEGTLRPAAASIEMRNLNLLFSNRYGYYPGGAYEGLVLERVDSSYAGISAYSPNGGSETTASYCVGRYTFDEDIFTVTGAGTRFTGSWCLAEYAWDDGFQATPGSTMTLDHCIARFNGMEEGADNTGFSAEGENITCGLYNCVAYANYGRGISHGATGTGGVTVKNCISYATVYSATYDAHIGASPSEFVHTNNIFGGKAVAWELDETESLADPLFVDPPYDLHLQAGSPAIDAGVAIEGITDGYLGDAPDIGVFEKA